ncbi:MAG: hypothetical protein COT21_00340 [Hadesarchaea archaeon CG08_land_8_20_14_0_20_51_8]|nr:MAG: hypothetical protein COT21_00340 [Hadesarchaea archaeon CG08_land_8_20_14_0_20_51_8]
MISIKELPHQFYIYLEDGYREKFFQNVRDRCNSWNSVRKTLGVSRSTLYSMRKGSDYHKTGKYRGGKTFVNVIDLRKLVRLSSSDLCDVENNISAVKLQTGKAVYISLPLGPSPQLASLVGHALGDGHIRSNYEFMYISKDDYLQDKVATFGKNVFGLSKIVKSNLTPGVKTIYFPRIVGRFLCLAGAVKGNKTLQSFTVPDWVENGSNEVKCAFLRALFDDEACVRTSKNSNDITFVMCKHEGLATSLEGFLEGLRHLLNEFEIRSCRVLLRARYQDRKKRQKVEMGFTICRKRNLVAFQKEIGFNHPNKNRKLINAISSYIYNV